MSAALQVIDFVAGLAMSAWLAVINFAAGLTMGTVLLVIHFAAGLIVLAEALNKLERTDIFDGTPCAPCAARRLLGLAWLLVPWRWTRSRVVIAFKLAAWALLAIGAAGALVTPMMHLEKPTLQDVAVIAGFALLIIRSRLKEEPTP